MEWFVTGYADDIYPSSIAIDATGARRMSAAVEIAAEVGIKPACKGLLYPPDFVGQGDMRRGSILLKRARDGQELRYEAWEAREQPPGAGGGGRRAREGG